MADPPPNVHLHCAQCDAQLGIFENEWAHLTASYARPKERGINLGSRVGDKAQVVPNGPGQKEAEGCVMVELFCTQCSHIVGQYCNSAPGPEQQYLINQRFFKLSRIYLKNAQTARREEPTFVDDDNHDTYTRPASVRSSILSKSKFSYRNGGTPTSFRQSYPPPPPSSQNPMYEPSHNRPAQMPPPSQVSHQTPLSSPYIHYSTQPNGYGYFQPPTRRMSDAPESYRPTSANGGANYQHESGEHSVALSECFNRIAAAERRLTNDEVRVLDTERRSVDTLEKLQTSIAPLAGLRQRFDQLEKSCKFQTNSCAKHHGIILTQDDLIKGQAKQIASLTDTLNTLHSSMEHVRIQVEELRSRPILEQTPRPNSHDFLENLEVMVKSMRTAQDIDDEARALREENKIMKARLKTIMTAMGSISEEDAVLLADTAPGQDSEDSGTLGKRKRQDDGIEREQRKVSRVGSNATSQDPLENQMLPTPDSTHVEHRSVDRFQVSSLDTVNGIPVAVSTTSVNDELSSQIMRDSVSMNDVGQEGVNAERDTSMSNQKAQGTNDQRTDSQGHTRGIAHERATGHLPTPDIHQTPDDSGVNSQFMRQTNNHSSLHPQGNSEPASHTRADLAQRPQQSAGSDITQNQHQTLYRSRYSRMVDSGSHYSPTGTSYLGTPVLPHSQTLGSFHGTIDPRLTRPKRDADNETFSDALSRGFRLEDIIQRPSRSSSTFLPDTTQTNAQEPGANITESRPEVHASVLQPRQGPASHTNSMTAQDRVRTSIANSIESPKISTAIDFSDEENAAPPAGISAGAQGTQVWSTTPTGEPRAPVMDRAMVAQAMRELASEPLQRPVIEDHNKLRRLKALRRAADSGQPSVLPGFAAAIHNLNDSAARHLAVSSSHSTNGETPKRPRKSEPVPRSSVDPEGVELTRQRDGPAATPSLNGDKSPLLGLDDAQGNLTAKTRGRGRPRKPRQSFEADISLAATEGENDDNCAVCSRPGRLLCCDGCPRSYHHRCLDPPMSAKQQVDGDWFCPTCARHREKPVLPERVIPGPPDDDTIIMVRRKLAAEAIARELAKGS